MESIDQNLVQRTLFAQESVKQLHQSDFVDLESETKINIIYRECMLVLFYASNIESRNLVEIWSEAAKNVVGPVFAACNLMVEKKVAEALTSLNMSNGVLHWAALKTIPFVLVYQNGWPIAFYNGERAVQPIIDYSLTLACKAEYHEPFNLFGGMTIQNNKNLIMKGVTQYGIKANPFKKDSVLYTGTEDMRGYDKDDVVREVGTPGEEAASAHTLASEEASKVGIRQSVEPVTAISTPTEQARVASEQSLPEVGGTRVAVPTEMEAPSGSSVL